MFLKTIKKINKIVVWQTKKLWYTSQIIFKYPREFINIIGFGNNYCMSERHPHKQFSEEKSGKC